MDTNLNRVMLTGYLVRDSMLRELPSGKTVCDMRIACNRRRQDKLTGTWVQWLDYCEARIIGPLASLIHPWLREARGVAIDGHLSNQRSYCNNPEHSWGIIVLVKQMQLLPQATEYSSDLNTPYTVDALPGIDAPLTSGAPLWSDAPPRSNAPRKIDAPRESNTPLEGDAPPKGDAIERPSSQPPVLHSSPQPPTAVKAGRRRARLSYGSIDTPS